MFEMTAGAMPHVDVSIRGFDMEVIQLPGGNFHHFVEHLQDNLIAF